MVDHHLRLSCRLRLFVPFQGDDDDVATQLFDLCLAEEKKMKGEVEEDDDDEEQDDDDALYIPEDDDDDEGP